MAIVDVLVTDQGVAAQQNLADINRTGTVTWIFVPGSDSLKVVFREFRPSGGGPSQTISAQGPFSQPLSTLGGRVTGTIDINAEDGLYLYDILGGQDRIPWLNGLSEDENFGGVEVHGPPPHGG